MIELHVGRSVGETGLLFDPGSTVTIGRDEGCVIPIEDTAASRVHCIVTFRAGQWLLRDVDSRNGTQVNEQTVQTHALRHGDVIRIGRTDIAVRITLRPVTPPPRDPQPAPANKALTPLPGSPPEVVPGIWPRTTSEDEPVDARRQPLTFFVRRGATPAPAAPSAPIPPAAPVPGTPPQVLEKTDLFAPDPVVNPPIPDASPKARRSLRAAASWTISAVLLISGVLYVLAILLVDEPAAVPREVASRSAAAHPRGSDPTPNPPAVVTDPGESEEVPPSDTGTSTPIGSSALTPTASTAGMLPDVDRVPGLELAALPASVFPVSPLPARTAGSWGGEFSALRTRPADAGDAIAENTDPKRREAIESALGWLARHQSADGHWAAADFAKACGDTPCNGAGKSLHDTGVTALAVLAFLGAGHAPGDGPHGAEILAALRWLVAQQAADGCLAPRKGKYMYSHAIATAALCEAFALKRAPALREPSRRAVELLVASQSASGGWRYRPGGAEADTSVTGWAVLALRRAESAGFPIAKSVFAKVQDFLLSVTDRSGHVGYQSSMDLGSRPEDGIDRFPPKEATTAIGMFCREICEPTAGLPPNSASVALVLHQHPVWGNEGDEADTIAWVFSATALGRASGAERKAWDAELLKSILGHQQQEGCAKGSWPAVGPWGASGGRICATALLTLTLEANAGGLLAGLEPGGRKTRAGKDR